MPWVLSENVRPYIIEALNIFAASQVEAAVKEKDRKIEIYKRDIKDVMETYNDNFSELIKYKKRISQLEAALKVQTEHVAELEKKCEAEYKRGLSVQSRKQQEFDYLSAQED